MISYPLSKDCFTMKYDTVIAAVLILPFYIPDAVFPATQSDAHGLSCFCGKWRGWRRRRARFRSSIITCSVLHHFLFITLFVQPTLFFVFFFLCVPQGLPHGLHDPLDCGEVGVGLIAFYTGLCFFKEHCVGGKGVLG